MLNFLQVYKGFFPEKRVVVNTADFPPKFEFKFAEKGWGEGQRGKLVFSPLISSFE